MFGALFVSLWVLAAFGVMPKLLCSKRIASRAALPEVPLDGLVLSLLLSDAGSAALLEDSRDAAGHFVDAGCTALLAALCDLSIQM